MKLSIENIEVLKMLAESGKTPSEIVSETSFSKSVVLSSLKKLGLPINKEKTEYRQSSASQTIYEILLKLFPNYTIEREYPLGDQLCLDFYIKELKIGIEVDGRQHEEYVGHFHGSRDKFVHGKNLDFKKEQICNIKNITLVRFKGSEEKNFSFSYVNAIIMKTMTE